MKIFKNILAIFVGLIVAFCLAEGILRVYNPFGFRVRGHQIIIPAREQFVISNNKGGQFDKVIIHTKNSLGFRGAEPPKDFADYLTILAVGGDTTECFYLSDDKTWPYLLGESLKKSFNNVWLNNAGLDGHSTFGHSILMKEYILKLRPKMILILAGFNDIGFKHESQPGKLVMTHSLIYKSEVLSLINNLMNYARTIKFAIGHGSIDLNELEDIDIPPNMRSRIVEGHQASLQSYERRLRGLVRLSEENKIVPVLITQPALFGYAVDDVTGRDLSKIKLGNFHDHMGGILSGGLKWDILELYNDVTRKVCSDENILVIDLARATPKSSRYFYDGLHFTNEGATKAAEIISRALVSYLGQKFPLAYSPN